VTQTELQSFYNSHFGLEATAHFQEGFICPAGHDDPTIEPEQGYDEDDDGLGYYPDGVKRTLTDEQIAIFRHSEIETLRREQEGHGDTLKRKSRDRSPGPNGNIKPNNGPKGNTNPNSSDTSGPSTTSTKSNEQTHQSPSVNTTEINEGSNNTKRKKKARREPKPDLRKRTWDVVDKGLDSLNYDDM
jgi:hypothetical protein